MHWRVSKIIEPHIKRLIAGNWNVLICFLFVAERLRNFAVEVLECENTSPVLCRNQTTAVNKAISLSCFPPIRGRYVKIKKYGPVDKTDVLTLCEVEVRGTNTGIRNTNSIFSG